MCSASYEPVLQQAKEDGKKAFLRGALRDENPHPINTMVSDSWLEGYGEEEEIAKENHDLNRID